MAIEIGESPSRGGGGIGNLLMLGVVGGAGYFGYQWWKREQVKAALLAEAARLQQSGMGIKEALTNAAAGACTAAATTYKIPASAAGPMCTGAAIVAIKAAELTLKGGKIAAKAIGKGTLAAGKGIGKGVKAAVYTAPKAVVKNVARGTKKVASKIVHGFGLWGIEGADYRSAVDLALADAGPRNPLAGARHAGGRRRPNPFKTHATLSGVSRVKRSRPARAPAPRVTGAAYYARLLG